MPDRTIKVRPLLENEVGNNNRYWDVFYLIDMNTEEILERANSMEELNKSIAWVKKEHPDAIQSLEIVQALQQW